MSRSEKLVSLFCREQNLIPDILSILTVASASEAIIACVLNFVENLLILDDDLSAEDNARKRVIHLYLESLVDNLKHLFEKSVSAKRNTGDRAWAMKRFKNAVTDSYMPEGITKKLFVPFFFTILMEEEKGEHIKNMCIDVLASISSREWSSSYTLLMRCFNEISKNPLKHKLLLRLICSILHQFHFSETIDTGSVNEIQTCLHNTVLPKIQKLLSDSEKVSVNISLAALRVLKLLPGDVMDSQLPSIIHRISNFLKNRLESIRDEARSALADCLKELGLEYLHFIVKVLQSTLKRGFELNVLAYTLNFILSKFLTLLK